MVVGLVIVGLKAMLELWKILVYRLASYFDRILFLPPTACQKLNPRKFEPYQILKTGNFLVQTHANRSRLEPTSNTSHQNLTIAAGSFVPR